MARDRANVNTAIWSDADHRQLTPMAQHFYYLLLTHPALSYVGVTDWRPNRLTQFAHGLTPEWIESAASELSDGLYIVIDEMTEEVLVRSFVKHDGVLKQPRLSISMANAFASTASNTLRGVIVHELKKQHSSHPEYKCWSDKRVLELLEQPAVDPSSLPRFRDGFTPNFALTFGDRFTPNATQRLALHTSTSTSSKEDRGAGRKRPATPLPESWQPNEAHQKKARESGVDIGYEAEQFRAHALANDRRLANWDMGFHRWITSQYARKQNDADTAPDYWN